MIKFQFAMFDQAESEHMTHLTSSKSRSRREMDSGEKLDHGVLLCVHRIARKRGGRLKILSNVSMTAVVRSRSGQSRTVPE